VLLATVYAQWLSVPVVDQFGAPVGDLYAGSPIIEDGWAGINQTLRADSTYLDPVGVIIANETTDVVQSIPDGYTDMDGNGQWSPGDILTNDYNENNMYDGATPRVAQWPTAAPTPLVPKTETQDIAVEVDVFPLKPGVVKRTSTANPPDTITIVWP
jgi:hypothetical protein